MYFSRSAIASVLMCSAAATTHSLSASGSLLASATASAAGMLSTASSSSGSSSSGAGMVPTHIVDVGGANGSLTFSPSNVIAKAGDLVQFHFYAKNHSVVQSTFDQPCVPIQNIMANKTDAFFSGFMPTNATNRAQKGVLTYTIHVKDTKPVWFYCSQAKHCQAGMVGAINAPPSGNKTMAAFTALAALAPANLSPGQAAGSGTNTPTSPSAGAGAGSGSGSGGAAGTGTGTAGGAQSSTGANPAQQSVSGVERLSAQSLVGGVVAGLVGLVVL